VRIAWYSPLPPLRSGIADYSAELLPALAEHLEIELVVDEGLRPDPALAGRFPGFPVHGHRALPGLLAAGRFDLVVYQLGNNPDYHGAIWRTLQEHPGVVTLHEAVLHHMIRELTLHGGDPEGYVRELRYAYGPTAEAMGRRCLETGIPLDPWSLPLFERAVDASLGVIVHNRATRERVLASRPEARIATIPLPAAVPEPSPGGPEAGLAAARAALGIPAGAFVVATFGFLTAAKRPEVLLRAFARLRRELPAGEDLRLYVVGEVSPHYDFAGLLGGEPGAGVTVTGRVGLDRFHLYMTAADVAVNLRYPTAGETSAVVVRLLGLGRPVIVSNAGAFAEIPEGCAAKVDVDDTEEELLLAYLRAFHADPALARAVGENARRHAAEHHTPRAAARAYADFLRGVLEEGARPFRAVPPLAPYPPEDLLSETLRQVSADAADLGAEESDEDLLRTVAEAVVGLGLGTARSRHC
jgi:glycosyltransferase involved in cell wall biosynthesis